MSMNEENGYGIHELRDLREAQPADQKALASFAEDVLQVLWPEHDPLSSWSTAARVGQDWSADTLEELLAVIEAYNLVSARARSTQ